MIVSLTPEELLSARVTAFQQKNFPSIFYSYHPDAPFLHFFPDVHSYLDYAGSELTNSFQIIDYEVLRTLEQDEVTDLLFRQQILHRGELLNSFEIARCCRNEEGFWLYFGSLRLDLGQLPGDILSTPWKDLVQNGQGLWI